jgi:hypothetical protein
MTDYLRNYVKGCAKVASYLYDILHANPRHLGGTQDSLESYSKIKKMNPSLKGGTLSDINVGRQLPLQTDALNRAIKCTIFLSKKGVEVGTIVDFADDELLGSRLAEVCLYH